MQTAPLSSEKKKKIYKRKPKAKKVSVCTVLAVATVLQALVSTDKYTSYC